MEEKKVTKISLTTFLVILAIIALIVICIIIFIINKTGTIQNQKTSNLQPQANNLNSAIAFSDEQVKATLSNYLELRSHANCDALLECLTKKGKLNYDSSKDTINNDGTVVTSIKFSDYKNAMLNYVSESEFNKNWTDKQYFGQNSNGYLTKVQGGGGLREYTIKSISKVDDFNYTGKATSVVEDGEYYEESDLSFVIASNNGICVIDSLKETTIQAPFTDEQVETALSYYLELRAHANCDALLENLTEKGNLNYNSSKDTINNDGTVVTSIKFSDYKNAMLNYVSESEFNKNWTDKQYFGQNSNGYLTKVQGGGGLREYTIKSISKINDNTYKAKTSSVVEDGEYYEETDYTFVIKSNNGKCVIDSIENSTEQSSNTSSSYTDDQVKTALSNYLELRAHANCDALLECLTKKGKLSYDSSKDTINNDGTVVTSIKFSDYKNAMLNYVSESEFNKNWTDKQYFGQNSNGYLTKVQGGGGLREYTIKSISKTNDNTYTAKTSSVVEDGEYYEENNYTFVVTTYNDNCVINSLN